MVLKLYKAGASRTEISDSVISLSGLEWRRKRDYSIILSHPTIEVLDTLSLALDDEIEFEINGSLRLRTYVAEIKHDQEKKLYRIQLYDLIKQLERYYISELTSSDWSGYSPSILEYKYVSGGGTYWDQQYIQAIFLIKVMLHKAIGVDIDDVLSTIDASTSPYDYWSGSIDFKYLHFNWRQLLKIKKDNSTDSIYKGATFLDIFLFLSQALKIKTYYSSSGYIYLSRYYGYSAPYDNNIFAYNDKEFPVYDFIQGSLKRLSTMEEYASAFDSGDLVTDEHQHPTPGDGDLKSKTYSLLNHFELHRHQVSSNHIQRLDVVDHENFLEQFVEFMEDSISDFSTEVSISTIIEYERDCLSNRLDWKNRKSDIVYGEA